MGLQARLVGTLHCLGDSRGLRSRKRTALGKGTIQSLRIDRRPLSNGGGTDGFLIQGAQGVLDLFPCWCWGTRCLPLQVVSGRLLECTLTPGYRWGLSCLRRRRRNLGPKRVKIFGKLGCLGHRLGLQQELWGVWCLPAKLHQGSSGIGRSLSRVLLLQDDPGLGQQGDKNQSEAKTRSERPHGPAPGDLSPLLPQILEIDHVLLRRRRDFPGKRLQELLFALRGHSPLRILCSERALSEDLMHKHYPLPVDLGRGILRKFSFYRR